MFDVIQRLTPTSHLLHTYFTPPCTPTSHPRLDSDGRTARGRLKKLRQWKREGGVMIIVHDTFRSILSAKSCSAAAAQAEA